MNCVFAAVIVKINKNKKLIFRRPFTHTYVCTCQMDNGARWTVILSYGRDVITDLKKKYPDTEKTSIRKIAPGQMKIHGALYDTCEDCDTIFDGSNKMNQFP